MAEEHHEEFNYTSGRWIYNEPLRLKERRLVFDIPELKRVAAKSVQRSEADIKSFRKFAEGGFNRIFEITMHDGLQILARLPYPSSSPARFATASEVATMDFLRSHGVPVPEIYGYSPHANNSVGAEYIVMEKIRGRPLGDIWYKLSEQEIVKLLSQVVKMEATLFSIDLPAYGSIYYLQDLPDSRSGIQIPGADPSRQLCLGPDTALKFWFEERGLLSVNRGPYQALTDVMCAGARKEIAWLRAYGKPRLPFERLYREATNFQKSQPDEHLQSLQDYVRIASHIIPKEDWLHKPTLRHPDLQPNNILVSDKHEIVGLIDWQHCSVLPLFLQAGIPTYFQNYGDEESERLKRPALPVDFEELDDSDKEVALDLFRRRQLHVYYVGATKKMNEPHFQALTQSLGLLRRKLFRHASQPWEGNNIPLKADLIRATLNWSELVQDSTPCPIAFRDEEANECFKNEAFQEDADKELSDLRDALGISTDGWTSNERYDCAVALAACMKAKAIGHAEDDRERDMTRAHWPFDDHNEKE